MYKLFEVIYNDGGWHSGDLPHFFFVAKNKEELVLKSKKYQELMYHLSHQYTYIH